MGRVSKTYPGPDNKVRAVDLFIAGKTFRRPVHKLVRLLGEDKDASSPRGEDVQATSSDKCLYRLSHNTNRVPTNQPLQN